MGEYSGLLFGGATLILNVIVLLVGTTWKVAAVKADLRKELDQTIDSVERACGETAAALRQKIHEVETWARDEFVRREGFYKVRDELVGDLRTLGEKIEARLERMEAKIDSKT